MPSNLVVKAPIDFIRLWLKVIHKLADVVVDLIYRDISIVAILVILLVFVLYVFG